MYYHLYCFLNALFWGVSASVSLAAPKFVVEHLYQLPPTPEACAMLMNYGYVVFLLLVFVITCAPHVSVYDEYICSWKIDNVVSYAW